MAQRIIDIISILTNKSSYMNQIVHEPNQFPDMGNNCGILPQVFSVPTAQIQSIMN